MVDGCGWLVLLGGGVFLLAAGRVRCCGWLVLLGGVFLLVGGRVRCGGRLLLTDVAGHASSLTL